MDHILNMSLYGSVAIIAVIILRLVFTKVPKKVTFWFWAAAFIRLVCPYNFGSVFSIFNIKSVELPIISEPVNTAKVIEDLAYKETLVPADAGGAVTEKVNDIAAAAAPVRETINLNDLMFMIWIAGIIVLAGVMLCRSLKLMKRPGLKSDRTSGIIEAGDINSSFVIGLIRPRICIPSYLEGFEKEYIIAHEETHIKNHDQFIKLLLFSVLCIHWFNPLVWLMYILASADIEMRCDEEVIDSFGDKVKKEYCVSMVLHASEGYKHIGILDSAFAKKTIGGLEIKMRIMNLVNYKKIPAAAAALCLIFAFGTTWALSSAAADISGATSKYATDLTPDAKPEGIKAFKLSDKDNYLNEIRKAEQKIVKDPKGRDVIDYGEKGGIHIKDGNESITFTFDTAKQVIPDSPADDFDQLAKRFNDTDHKISYYKYSRFVDTDYMPELSVMICHKDSSLVSEVNYWKATYASFEDFKDTQFYEEDESKLLSVKCVTTNFGFSKIIYNPFIDLEVFRYNYYSDLDIMESIENRLIQTDEIMAAMKNLSAKNEMERYNVFSVDRSLVYGFKYSKDSDVDYLPFCYVITPLSFDNISDFEASMNKAFIDEDGLYRFFKENENGLGSHYEKIISEYFNSPWEMYQLYGEDVDKINDRMLKFSHRGFMDINYRSVSSKAYSTDKGYRIDFRDPNDNILAYVTYDKENKWIKVFNLI